MGPAADDGAGAAEGLLRLLGALVPARPTGVRKENKTTLHEISIYNDSDYNGPRARQRSRMLFEACSAHKKKC